MRDFFINENDSGQRIDRFILKVFPMLPKSMMYKLIRKKDIKINGKRCEISTRLKQGDIVSVYISDKFSGNHKKDYSFLKASESLEIIYEDENLLIVNKNAGIPVHCDNEHSLDTLINRVKLYLYRSGCYKPDEEVSFSPALCSRLDKNTCGIVTAAKNATALREINKCIRNGNAVKIYHCVTVGIPKEKKALLTAYHFKEPEGNIVRISNSPIDGYKQIKTGYRILRCHSPLALLEVKLFTGKTHQIRAHLANEGIPILGDAKYGIASENKKYGIYHQCLCAFSLKFKFESGSPLEYLNDKTFFSPLPEFENLV